VHMPQDTGCKTAPSFSIWSIHPRRRSLSSRLPSARAAEKRAYVCTLANTCMHGLVTVDLSRWATSSSSI
jgi:hypothetical protein